jgi:uncharacterized membrane protein YphA (DoxX/SURF4 family)
VNPRALVAARLYARLALGAAFLSAVASRLGLWRTSDFARFERYAGEVLSFAPAGWVPFLARAATVAETALGLALVAGFRPRLTGLASAVLLAVFGLSMAISFGPKEPLDYSVFSASACALLLAAATPRREP